ncbi:MULTISPECIES: hypothetical protein [Burkholderia]|uniref:hypothetical protein n=1 Tax=Burkholderia TaxID=32008 RepID=UPI001F08C97E|nr:MULTISPECIES: hypothetical protein [Burkholderia]
MSALVASKLQKRRSETETFHALELKAMSELIMQFTRRDVSEQPTSTRRMALLDDMKTAVQMLEPAASVFAAWPSGYLTYLSALHQRVGDAEMSIRTAFSSIYLYICSNKTVDGFEPMVGHFQQYLIEHWPWPVLDRGNELLGSIAHRLNWIWAANAARFLNVKESKVREFMSKRLIEGKSWPLTKSRVLTAVRRDELPRMRQLLDDQATSRELRSIGISARRRLVLAPLLFPEAKYKGIGIGWQVSQARIREILAFAAGRPIVDTESSSQIALGRILRSCAWRNEMVERLFRLILRGEVRWSSPLKRRTQSPTYNNG